MRVMSVCGRVGARKSDGVSLEFQSSRTVLISSFPREGGTT